MKGELGINAQTHYWLDLGTQSFSSLASNGIWDSAICNICCYWIQQSLTHVNRATLEVISIPL